MLSSVLPVVSSVFFNVVYISAVFLAVYLGVSFQLIAVVSVGGYAALRMALTNNKEVVYDNSFIILCSFYYNFRELQE